MNWPFIVGAALGLVIGALGGFAFAAYLLGGAMADPQTMGDLKTNADLRTSLIELEWRGRSMIRRCAIARIGDSSDELMSALRDFAAYLDLASPHQGDPE